MINETDSFILKFPEGSGFDSTHIHFYAGEPDVWSLYLEKPAETNRLFVTDETIGALESMKPFISHFNAEPVRGTYSCGKDVLVILGSGESYKTIESVLEIVKAGINANFNRNCLFVGIGGGVILDMTGFAASMFKRGVDCEFVSTTLLADVDASVGGKTGCDFDSYKNMIGAFWPSRQLHIWPSFVKTLSRREFISGLAEAVKTAFLFDEEMTRILENESSRILACDEEILVKFISKCTTAKARIVQEDPKEKGRRAFLNLGHTFGHALESVAGLGKVTHGEGVAWGIGRALDYAALNSLCTKEFADKGKKILSLYGYDTNPIPAALENVPDAAEKLLSAMHKDKKNNKAGITRIILQTGTQQTVIHEATDSKILEVLK